MYKKAWCTRKVVVLLIKPIVFLTFLLPFARGGNFRCWPKAETARKKAFRAGHHKDLTEKGKSLVPKIYIPRILREIGEWTVISKAHKLVFFFSANSCWSHSPEVCETTETTNQEYRCPDQCRKVGNTSQTGWASFKMDWRANETSSY